MPKYEYVSVGCPYIALWEGRKYSYVTVDFIECYDPLAEDYGEKLRSVVEVVVREFLNYVVPRSQIWSTKLKWVVDKVKDSKEFIGSYWYDGCPWLSVTLYHITIRAEKEVIEGFIPKLLEVVPTR
jgi:hypothetical protein